MARAWDLDLAIDFTFTEPDVNYRPHAAHRVLIHQAPPIRRRERRQYLWATLVAAALGDISSPGFEVFGDRTKRRLILSNSQTI